LLSSFFAWPGGGAPVEGFALSSFFAWPGGGAPVDGFALSSFFAWPGGSDDDGVVEEGVVLDGVVDELDPPEGVLVDDELDDGELEEEPDEPDDGLTVDAPDVDPVFSPGFVVEVVVEVVLVPLPLPEDGVAGLLEDVVLAAQPDTNSARTMG
jgi:hypothetical protein